MPILANGMRFGAIGMPFTISGMLITGLVSVFQGRLSTAARCWAHRPWDPRIREGAAGHQIFQASSPPLGGAGDAQGHPHLGVTQGAVEQRLDALEPVGLGVALQVQGLGCRCLG
jgi:hypothetical protein